MAGQEGPAYETNRARRGRTGRPTKL